VLDILSVKKEAKLSAREIHQVEEGNGEEDLRCKFVHGLPAVAILVDPKH